MAMLIFSCSACKDNPSQSLSSAGIRMVKTRLNYPWEIIWGKDNHIWMTEREGKISRIDPANGNTTFSFMIPDAESNNEGGLLGMALHPDFAQNGFLYVVYDYRKGGGYKEKLVRYTFANNTLNNPVVLLDGIEASSNHDGSRLWITNDRNPKIFMTTGDALNQSLPQNKNTVNGKVLRLNIDGSIPSDNPFLNNPVWSSCNGSETSFCTTNNIKEPIWSSGNSTIAVCGLDYYNNNLLPQWKNSLLMMTLKNSSIRQLKLSDDGRSIIQTQTFFKDQWGRLRDLCISPAGKVYVCTSNGGNNDLLVEISRL